MNNPALGANPLESSRPAVGQGLIKYFSCQKSPPIYNFEKQLFARPATYKPPTHKEGLSEVLSIDPDADDRGSVCGGGPPPLVWLSRPLRGSCRKENPPAEQVEAGATIHLPLDQLEPGDLPLRLAAAPGRRERGLDRSAVLLQPRRKGLERADPRPPGVGQPGGQRHARRLRADRRVDPTPAHEGRQPAGQPGNVRSRRVLLDPRHEGCIRPRQRRRGLDEQPGKLRG